MSDSRNTSPEGPLGQEPPDTLPEEGVLLGYSLEDERRTLGDFMFQQEYEIQFLDDELAVFSSELIEAAISSEVQPLWPTVSQARA